MPSSNQHKAQHPTAKHAAWLVGLGDRIEQAVSLLDECLNDGEPWEPEKLVERMEDVREVLTGRRSGV